MKNMVTDLKLNRWEKTPSTKGKIKPLFRSLLKETGITTGEKKHNLIGFPETKLEGMVVGSNIRTSA